MQFEEMMAREKELDRYRMATSTKCLSCGQNRPEPPHHRSITGSPTRDIVRTQPPIRRGKTPEGIPLMLNDEKSVSIPKPIDDELSNDGSPRYMHIAGVPQVSVELEKGSTLDQDTWLAREIVQPDPTRLGMSDELHSLLTGNTGLKSLLPQHAPLLPVKDPYGERRKSIEKSPDPLYRKAKIQAHIKEMVKIAAPVASKNFRTSASTPTLPPTVAASLNAKYLLDNGDFNGFSYVEDNVKFTNSSITSNSRAPLGRGALKSAGPGRSVLSASAERMIRPSSSKSRINPSSLRSGSDHSIHHVASNSLGYHSKSRDADHMNSRGLHSPPLLEDSVISQDSQSIVPILPALTQNGVLCTGDERAPEGINGYNE